MRNANRLKIWTEFAQSLGKENYSELRQERPKEALHVLETAEAEEAEAEEVEAEDEAPPADDEQDEDGWGTTTTGGAADGHALSSVTAAAAGPRLCMRALARVRCSYACVHSRPSFRRLSRRGAEFELWFYYMCLLEFSRASHDDQQMGPWGPGPWGAPGPVRAHSYTP